MKNNIKTSLFAGSLLFALPGMAQDELKLQFAPANHGVWLYVSHQDVPVAKAVINVKGSLLPQRYQTDANGVAFISNDKIKRNLPSIEVTHRLVSGEDITKTVYLPFYL